MIPFAIELICIAILCAIAAVIAVDKLRDYAILREEGRRSGERSRSRKRIEEELERLTIYRFPCGAKAVKFDRAAVDKAVASDLHGNLESVREGDVFLYCRYTCDKRSRCALHNCLFDPHWRRLELKALSEAARKVDPANGDKVASVVFDDDSRVPALAMIDVILKVKGFVFNSDFDIVVDRTPFSYLAYQIANDCDRRGNDTVVENR